MLADVRDLRVLNPGFEDLDRITITAPHGHEYVRDHMRVMTSWEQAAEGIELFLAFTARGRSERQPRARLRDTVDRLSAETGTFAFVYGREDHGLPNSVVDRCHGYVSLESSDEYRSFNLAQAVMVALYSLRERAGSVAELKVPQREFERAPGEQVERMMGTAEEALDKIEFFKGDQRENVLRTIRRVILRAEVDTQELATFWAMFAKIRREG
ncbi:MAG: TrmH family RNA methyltransferase [Bradymonadia bacterium]|jgi:TrmH family RNA methyltransferase